MDTIFNIWKSSDQLRSLSSYLQWISISLVFLGAILQVAKIVVDRQEKLIVTIEQRNHENILQDKITNLETDLINRQKDITELNKKTQLINPYTQPIRTGTATVEITIASDENVNSHFMDRGGFIGFGKGKDPLLIMGSIDSFGMQNGKGEVTYRGIFNLDATHPSIGKPVLFLKEAEYIQVLFSIMPKKMKVLRGQAICTFNNTVRIEIPIPSQQMESEFIYSRNLKTSFKDIKQ